LVGLRLLSQTWGFNQASIVGLRKLSTNLHSMRYFNQIMISKRHSG
jgi:hypothetical protein